MATKTATKASSNGTGAQAEAGLVTDIRHVIRRIGVATNPELGIFTASEVENHLKTNYFDSGWELYSAQMIRYYTGREIGSGLGMDPVEMLYVLVQRAAA